MDIPGGELRQTVTHNGATYTRTIKQYAAIATAARLLRAANAGEKPQRADLERGKEILRLAQWHRAGPEGGRKSPQTRKRRTATQQRENFREIKGGGPKKTKTFDPGGKNGT